MRLTEWVARGEIRGGLFHYAVFELGHSAFLNIHSVDVFLMVGRRITELSDICIHFFLWK